MGTNCGWRVPTDKDLLTVPKAEFIELEESATGTASEETALPLVLCVTSDGAVSWISVFAMPLVRAPPFLLRRLFGRFFPLPVKLLPRPLVPFST